MNYTLRKFQTECYKVCDEIIQGKQIEKIFLAVCPGGGKSTVPAILADSLLNTGKYDKICWVAPRENLVIQGEDDFINSFIPHDHIIRSAKNNDIDLSKDRSGYIATMQSIIANPGLHEKEIASYRYILFIDEFQFLSMDNVFKKEIEKLITLAALVVFASGTIERGQGDKVAFVPYLSSGKIDFANTNAKRWIIYSRKTALREKAIAPLKFHTIDSSGEFVDKGGVKRNYKILGDDSNNLNCSLRTGFAYQLIDKAYDIYLKEKKKYDAKMIVIAPNIETGEKYQLYISEKTKETVEIATSNNSIQARKNIKSFKLGHCDILVGIGMFYIGFSCKQIGVVCSLTHIRSLSWLKQMVARANRLYPGKKHGHIVAPADIRFKKFISVLEKEQAISAVDPDPKTEPVENGLTSREKADITPIFSKAHIDPIPVLAERFRPDSEIEKEYRQKIDQIIKSYVLRMITHMVDGEERVIKTEAGRYTALVWLRIAMIVNRGRDKSGKLIRKKIAEMTIKELEKVFEFVEANYT